MKDSSFILQFQSPFEISSINDVTSFVAVDASGSFGIRPHHEPMMTILSFGFATIRDTNGKVFFVAHSGGVFYFDGQNGYVVTRRFARSERYQDLVSIMDKQSREEEESLAGLKESLRKLEESMYQRLYQAERAERKIS